MGPALLLTFIAGFALICKGVCGFTADRRKGHRWPGPFRPALVWIGAGLMTGSASLLVVVWLFWPKLVTP